MLKENNIVIVGAGTMGRTIIKGLLKSGEIKNIKAVERNEKYMHKALQQVNVPICTIDNCKEDIEKANIIVICVKPQDVSNCLGDIKKYLNKDTLIISIAAGINIQHIEDRLTHSNPVVRSMPNTPCVIGEGMTVVCKGTQANKEHINLSIELFGYLGKVLEIEEKHMNAVTGLSGSGPAFIYLIIEALSDGGVMEGLPRKVATQLAAQTMLGAARMVLETGKHPAELKDEVSTPAGCTIGAILSLEDGRIRSVLARSVQEAAKISSKLGS